MWEEIKYSCGHDGRVQMYGKSSEHAAKAAWYERSCICPACLDAERAATNEAAAQAAKAQGMPDLTGTAKQVAWATTIRQEMYNDAISGIDADETTLRNAGTHSEDEIAVAIQTARGILAYIIEHVTSASVWIDNRRSDWGRWLRDYKTAYAETVTAEEPTDTPAEEVTKTSVYGNIGNDNTGRGNIGNGNLGDGNHGSGNHGSGNIGGSNTGGYNIGDCNEGDYNIGSNNSGCDNIGSGNSGHRNIGDGNPGNRNIGYRNGGDGNIGDNNSGCDNIGSGNIGRGNIGRGNEGGGNIGSGNIGAYNLGDGNLGDGNSGDGNSGDHNLGYRNEGYCNLGDGNLGDYNLGAYNLGDYNLGCFNTLTPKIYLFDKLSDWTLNDWYTSQAKYLLDEMPHKGAGNAKAAQAWWCDLSDQDKAVIMAIPNFDKAIFARITGIDVDTKKLTKNRRKTL